MKAVLLMKGLIYYSINWSISKRKTYSKFKMLIYGERLNFSLRSNRLPDFLQYVLKYLIIEFEDDSRFSYPFLAGQLRFQQNLII